jgi:hypothetical protein
MVNTSGLACLEFNVLVKEEEGDLHKRFKAAGLQLAGEAADRDKHASTIGHIIHVSPTAFTYEDWKGQDDMKPKARRRVSHREGQRHPRDVYRMTDWQIAVCISWNQPPTPEGYAECLRLRAKQKSSPSKN